MKRFFDAIFWTLVLTFGTIQLSAQCTEDISPSFTTNFEHTTIVQTFTAICSGDLLDLTINVSGATDGDVIVSATCQDAGPNPLVQQNFSISGGSTTINFSSPPTLVAGQSYALTFFFNGLFPQISVGDNSGVTSYDGGEILDSGSCAATTGLPPTYDLDFSYTIDGVEEPPTAVPTMGEWALIIFALIILNMAVLTLMHFEKEKNRQLKGAKA